MFNWNDGSDYLMHHGIKGQKWGIRRFQNLDGTLTAEGRERYSVGDSNRPHSRDKKVGTGSITVSKGAKASKSGVGTGARANGKSSSANRSINSGISGNSSGKTYQYSSGFGKFDPDEFVKDNKEEIEEYANEELDHIWNAIIGSPTDDWYALTDAEREMMQNIYGIKTKKDLLDVQKKASLALAASWTAFPGTVAEDYFRNEFERLQEIADRRVIGARSAENTGRGSKAYNKKEIN